MMAEREIAAPYGDDRTPHRPGLIFCREYDPGYAGQITGLLSRDLLMIDHRQEANRRNDPPHVTRRHRAATDRNFRSTAADAPQANVIGVARGAAAARNRESCHAAACETSTAMTR